MTTFQFVFIVSLVSVHFYGLINDAMRKWTPAPSKGTRRAASVVIVATALGASWLAAAIADGIL